MWRLAGMLSLLGAGCTFPGQGLSRAPADGARRPVDRASSEAIVPSVERGIADAPDATELGLRSDAKPEEDLPRPGADVKTDAKPKADAPRADLPPQSCDDLFQDTVPGYVACTPPDGTTCRFYFKATTATSCATLCGVHPCQKMEDNDPGVMCNAESPNLCGSSPCQCNTAMLDSICTCKK